MSDNKQQQQINIEIDEKTADGVYSNLAIINHSASEFIVDFVSIMPGSPKARVKSRVILTPQHAKRLLKAMAENIQRFENTHGEIKDTEQPSIPLNFGPAGQA
ncbi:MAG TPA: DUF3467 domain-containing protein [Flavobacterium sp.]|nr:DUF3467 domain-containing protein [Flavobacterium sp.]